MKKVLFVIAQQGFRDEELFETRKVLNETYSIHIASLKKGLCTGKLGATATADYDLVSALKSVSSFDAVVFVGGPGALVLCENRTAHELARTATSLGKVVGAICVAPVLLCEAGLLNGKKVTVFPDSGGENEAQLKEHGALLQNKSVVVDDRLVTANGPLAALEFGKQLKKVIA